MTQQPHLRRGAPDDETEVRDLLQTVLPGNVKCDADIMRWQYRDNPFGEAITWVWEDASRIVGHYAWIPVPLLIAGKPARGVIGADAAYAAEYRGRGLHSATIVAGEKLGREMNVSVTLFFPAARSALPSRATSLAWPLRVYMMPLDSGWFAGRTRVPTVAARAVMSVAFRLPSGVGAELVSVVPDGIDDLWTELAPRLPCGIVKDAVWWQWRFGDHPHRPYGFVTVRERGKLCAAGATVLRDAFGGRIVYVLELLAVTRSAAKKAIGAIVAGAEGRADAVAMAVLPGTPQAQSARAGGLRRIPRRLESNPVSFALFDRFGNRRQEMMGPWSVTWGDMDHL